MNDLAKTFDATPVDYAKVASQVLNLKPRALTPPQYEDVVTLIEWMQTEATRMHNANTLRNAELDQREEKLTQREREVAIRARTVQVAAGFKTSPAKRYFWR